MAFKDVVPIILHVDSDPTFQQLIIVLEYIPVLNFELDFRISLQNYISKYYSVSVLFRVHFYLLLLQISIMVD